MRKILVSLSLALVLAMVGSMVWGVADAQRQTKSTGTKTEGQQCETGGKNYLCAPNFACKPTSATPKGHEDCSSLSSLCRCECAWGDIEVGFLGIEPGSICRFVGSTPASGLIGARSFVGQVIVAVMALTVVAALVSIVIGGYIYMTAGGSADRIRTAKVWIVSAIIGVVIALIAWLILNTISSNLV